MREDGDYTSEEFRARKEEVDNEIVAEKISLSESRIDQFDIEAALAYAKHFIMNLGRQWFDCPHDLRSRFQKLVLPEGIAYNRQESFRTAKLGCIFELNQQFAVSNSSLVDHTGFEPVASSMPWKRSTKWANGPFYFKC